ncbi:hypothetical protein VDG1235_2321 [Verrucomicrobiia bacterium DG1235]|nr:hypothetical protein VDG1235_2321 [Verrucomicrobiae bacterium DG1235]
MGTFYKYGLFSLLVLCTLLATILSRKSERGEGSSTSSASIYDIDRDNYSTKRLTDLLSPETIDYLRAAKQPTP